MERNKFGSMESQKPKNVVEDLQEKMNNSGLEGEDGPYDSSTASKKIVEKYNILKKEKIIDRFNSIENMEKDFIDVLSGVGDMEELDILLKEYGYPDKFLPKSLDNQEVQMSEQFTKNILEKVYEHEKEIGWMHDRSEIKDGESCLVNNVDLRGVNNRYTKLSLIIKIPNSESKHRRRKISIGVCSSGDWSNPSSHKVFDNLYNL